MCIKVALATAYVYATLEIQNEQKQLTLIKSMRGDIIDNILEFIDSEVSDLDLEDQLEVINELSYDIQDRLEVLDGNLELKLKKEQEND